MVDLGAAGVGVAVLLAAGIDRAWGEPPDRWHPVAWLGHVAAPLGRWLRVQRPAAAFVGGAVAWVLLVGGPAAASAWVEGQLALLATWLAVPLLAVLLKPTFAWRMLRDEVAAVEAAFAGPAPLDAARAQLARLVSREVSDLPPDALRETAIETLAENLSDSLVAPLFWFAVAGLPGAVVYRVANTLDAMWGYRGPWEWAGKWAARADDVLSFVPARLTAVLLMARARSLPWRALRGEARRTPSPNGGWPMGAMALRLGVRLGKPGVYLLNGTGRAPQAHDVHRALALAGRAAAAGILLAAAFSACSRA